MLSAKEIELQAFNLAMVFRREFLKYDKRIFTSNTLKQSRWWRFFLTTIEQFASREEWNIEVFVKAQFYTEGKIYPYFLVTKKAWGNFLDYKNLDEVESNQEADVVRYVLNGFSAVRDYCARNNHQFSVAYFIDDTYNEQLLLNNYMPLHFFLFSKAFNEKYHIKDDEKKIKVKRNKELLNKVKNVLKDDYAQ